MHIRALIVIVAILVVIVLGVTSTMKRSVKTNEAREAQVTGTAKPPPAPASKP